MKLEHKPVDHINLQVPNLEKAIAFYTEVMNFEIRDRYKGSGKEFVFLTNGDVVYEVLENTSVTETVMHHIAYATENIEEEYQYFKELGGDLLQGEIGENDFIFGTGLYYFFIKSPCGELIEYCQKK